MDEDVDAMIHAIEHRDRQRTEAIKRMLINKGRRDLADELDAKLKDVRTGVAGAQSTWHSISPAQRRVLTTLATGRWLIREHGSLSWYEAHGEPEAMARVCRLPTARNLIARELLACEGGAFDPERKLVLTERARFVLRHGPVNPSTPLG